MSDQDQYMSSEGDLLPGQLFDREMEEALIGAVLINQDVYLDVSQIVEASDFYYKSHQYIWEAIQHLYATEHIIDALAIHNELIAQNHADDTGGIDYLAGLANRVPSSLHAEYYAKSINDLAIRRRLLASANDIAKLAYRKDFDIDTTIEMAEQSVFGISESRYKSGLVPVSNVVRDFIERLSEKSMHTGELSGLGTGLKSIDAVLDGLHRSDFIIVAGRPGMGKTGFLTGIARYVGLELKRNVAIFSLEMSAEQVLERLLAQLTGIDSQKLRSARMSNSEMDLAMHALELLSEAHIYVDDTPAITPMQLHTKCMRLKEQGLDLVIVDYLQLMSGGVRTENRVQEVSYISRALKGLARDLDIPVLAAAQLSRAIESRQDKNPVLSDLRESGSLEQDADIVMFINRPHLTEKDNPDRNKAKLSVAKHRNGPVHSGIELVFIEPLAMFHDLYKGNIPE
ncbi:MAG TPA: replicative DNA helicase [Anaerolineaceae bacterium]|nr:replicative DNA helicase [Anaerolineaceae bacterium]